MSEHNDQPSTHTFDQLRETGLLWLINRCVFHPRGYALGLDYAKGESEPNGWRILAADEGECYTFGLSEQEENQYFGQVEKLLTQAREQRGS